MQIRLKGFGAWNDLNTIKGNTILNTGLNVPLPIGKLYKFTKLNV